MSDHGHGSLHVKQEADKSNVGGLVAFLIALMVFHFGSVFGIYAWFQRESEAKVLEMNLGRDSRELQALRRTEAETLGGYGVADKAKGLYRVPVQKAAELYLAEVRALPPGSPVRVGPTEAPAAPAPAPVDPNAPVDPSAPPPPLPPGAAVPAPMAPPPAAPSPAAPTPAPAPPPPAPGGTK